MLIRENFTEEFSDAQTTLNKIYFPKLSAQAPLNINNQLLFTLNYTTFVNIT